MAVQDEYSPWDEEQTLIADTSTLRADTYEQIKLTGERRKLQVAERRKFEKMQPCLELSKAIAETRLEIAREKRLRAEAETARARELRRVGRERRRAAEAEKATEELKLQAAQEIGRLVERARQAEAEAQSEYEKRLWAELGERFDPQTAEFLTCPSCAERMGVPEPGRGRECPSCGHRREL